MLITSPVFEQMQKIPKKYTCEGENVSPPLILDEIPANTKSIALIMDDPDAPSGVFDHWIVWNIDPKVNKIPEGQSFPNQGITSYGEQKYAGPCPPPGKPHRYFFKVYALDTMLKLQNGITKKQLMQAIHGHIIDEAELVGIYQR
jgi:Raf kinase inhibitor-like YbhB/YbcL family protein